MLRQRRQAARLDRWQVQMAVRWPTASRPGTIWHTDTGTESLGTGTDRPGPFLAGRACRRAASLTAAFCWHPRPCPCYLPAARDRMGKLAVARSFPRFLAWGRGKGSHRFPVVGQTGREARRMAWVKTIGTAPAAISMQHAHMLRVVPRHAGSCFLPRAVSFSQRAQWLKISAKYVLHT